MNVLLIGSGGREHALALAISRSPILKQLYTAPGNPGTAALGENVALDASDHRSVIDFCLEHAIGLVVIGPEAPLVAGLTDDLEEAGFPVFGPSKAAAQLEGSKGFTKDLCREFNIPTGAYQRFTEAEPAIDYARAQKPPIVIKADGLAAGKGVIIAPTFEDAERAIQGMFDGMFGAAGAEVVIEEFLEGEEASFFALCDGERAVAFASAQDHKRVGEGDTGPNTGGMGAYSPAPIMTPEMTAQVMREIVEPALKGMRARGAPYKGVLFAGLMIGHDGPKLIEFNARFGDPETQVMLPRLDQDLLPLLLECAERRLPETPIRLKAQEALTVVYAAEGYPEAPLRGTEIKGLNTLASDPHVIVFHAGTKLDGERLLANGGRVLTVTGLGDTIMAAKDAAYGAVARIDWPGGFYRRDIGWRAITKYGTKA
ncbi:MAG: phosphoribosylamine--glycine ligase [Hyphomicrobiales bacterium]|nr:phosphoribosylamine--glycine ligase [Hyphomicrobiales bacterium]